MSEHQYLGMSEDNIERKIGNILWEYWDSIAGPKPSYTDWYYGSKFLDGLRELLALRKDGE